MKRTALHKATATVSLLCAVTVLPAVSAAPITAAFALVNTNADGFVTTPSALLPGDLSSFDLTGGNLGSGVGGQTQFIGTAPAAGTVQFQWSYTSCYPPNQQPSSIACDFPAFDWAGYLINQTFTILTDADTVGVTASASFPVSAGAVFGWYVETLDNLGEPGTLSVSNVSFAESSGVPEPGTLTLCLAGVVLALAAGRRNVLNILFQTRRKI